MKTLTKLRAELQDAIELAVELHEPLRDRREHDLGHPLLADHDARIERRLCDLRAILDVLLGDFTVAATPVLNQLVQGAASTLDLLSEVWRDRSTVPFVVCGILRGRLSSALECTSLCYVASSRNFKTNA